MRRRATNAAVIAVFAAAVALLGGCSSPPPFQQGDCVALAPASPLRPVSCNDPDANKQITRVTDADFHICDDLPGAIPYGYDSVDSSDDYGLCLSPHTPNAYSSS